MLPIISFEYQSSALGALDHDKVAHGHVHEYLIDPVSLVLENKAAISRTPHQVLLELPFLVWISVSQPIVHAHYVLRYLLLEYIVQNV